MKVQLFISTILFSLFFHVLTPIPVWDLASSSIDLLSSSSTYSFPLYSSSSYDISVTLTKEITKSGDNITSKNYLTVDSINTTVDFEGIDSHYANKLGCDILICPKGKFHPYDFINRRFITPPSFEEKGDWDLRCYDHFTGFFLIFYLMNNGKNFYYHFENGIVQYNGYNNSNLFDFKLENNDGGYDHFHEYKFSIITIESGNIFIRGNVLVLNYVDIKIDSNTFASKFLNHAKTYSQASFDSNHIFYYFTYNNFSDFISGYSNSYVDFSSREIYISSIDSISITQNSDSPFSFIDDVEIKEMNFIRGTQYVYYEIYNKNNVKSFYGILDIKLNKILYNIEEEFKTFIPTSNSGEMFAISAKSAYKICIVKDGNSCMSLCSSGNLILDPDGNSCQIYCDSGKIKLMPEGICISQSTCDLNIFTINSDGTECGLCSYFYPTGAKYKLINVPECLSTIPENAEYYNENLYLLKCKSNYYLNSDNECVPDSCYERCEACSEMSNDVTDQKCTSCKSGYIFENGNCIIPPTTTINPPTTTINPPTTTINPPTTTINPPTTTLISSNTEIMPPTTIFKIDTTTPKEILCTKGSYISEDNKCLNCTNLCKDYEKNKCDCLECYNGYYLNTINKNCTKCDNICENYLPNNCQCQSCPKNYGLENNKCFECTGCLSSQISSCKCSSCLNGFYLDSNDYICKRCNESCINYEENTCKCVNEYFSFYGYYKGINETINILKTSNLTNIEKNILEVIRTKLNNGNINSSHLDNGNYFFVESPKTKFIISKSDYKEDITTTVDLGQCEDKLRTNKSLTKNNSFYILYIEVEEVGLEVPRTEYEVYYKSDDNNDFKNLDLDICKGININKTVSINISEDDIDKYNSSSGYYNDFCYTCTSDNGTDITLTDRRNEYINQNMSVCEVNCQFVEYDSQTGKAVCSCPIAVQVSHISDYKIDKDKLKSNFINFKNIANIKLLRCYHLLFSNKIFKNIGAIIISVIILIGLISLILFYFYGYNTIMFKLKYIFDMKSIENKELNNKNNIKIFENKEQNSKTKLKKNEDKKVKKRKRKRKSKSSIKSSKSKHKQYPPRKSLENNKDQIKPLSMKRNNNIDKIPNSFTLLTHNKEKLNKGKKNSLIKEELEYNDTEMNLLTYQEALELDKRTYGEYYVSLLRTRHLLVFSFCNNKDYNSSIIKINLFLFTFAVNFTINALFFNDSTMHKIYEDGGKFDFIYQIPQILYSALISSVTIMIVKMLALSEKNILKIKGAKKDDFIKIYKSEFNYIKCKFICFFIFMFIFLFIFWYYVGCFCAVNKNTQIHLLTDTLISFGTSLLYPLGIYFIPGIFRITALKNKEKKGEYMYNFSKIIQLFC